MLDRFLARALFELVRAAVVLEDAEARGGEDDSSAESVPGLGGRCWASPSILGKMRSLMVMVVLLSSCGSRSSNQLMHTSDSRATRATAEPEPTAVPLEDIQIQCRSSEMVEIGKLDASFGPSCSSKTFPLSLNTFDLGSFDGMTQIMEWSHVQTMLCICSDGKCSEEMAAEVMKDAKRVFADEAGKREREGVLKVTNSLQSHSCLSVVAGAQLYKLGFACGFVAGQRSPKIIQEQIETLMKVLSLDEAAATEKMSACSQD